MQHFPNPETPVGPQLFLGLFVFVLVIGATVPTGQPEGNAECVQDCAKAHVLGTPEYEACIDECWPDNTP